MKKILAILFLLIPFSVYGGDGSNIHWVDDTGTKTTWLDCESATPLSGTDCCDLGTAEAGASAGDTVNFRTGTYGSLVPANSGTSGSKITWQAYNSESVTFDCSDNDYGFYLNGKDYHVIDDLDVDCDNQGTRKCVWLENGSDYNEIRNCVIEKGGDTPKSGMNIRDTGGDNGGSKHNWIHDNTFREIGWMDTGCDDKTGVFYIGTTYGTGDNLSGNNTIEDNVLYWGAHHLMETYTKNNVIRNNIFHNEGWLDHDPACDPEARTDCGGYQCGPDPDTGLWGNRCLQVYDDYSEDKFNLIEGNRFGHAAHPPDDTGANNLVITSPKNIARYNFMFSADRSNFYLKTGTRAISNNNRFYNNTLYVTTGVVSPVSKSYNIFIGASTGNVIKNNLCYGAYEQLAGVEANNTAGQTYTNNWESDDADPLFVDTTLTNHMSLTLPDLSLQSGSGAIDGGVQLTDVASGDDGSDTTIEVDDALYFQDGTWGSSLSNIQADWICVGTISNCTQITSINYTTNIITVSPAVNRSSGDDVWLYKDSDGTIVLVGSAPDQGAYEYVFGSIRGINPVGVRLH